MESKLDQRLTEIKGIWYKSLWIHVKQHWYVYSCLLLSILAAVFFMMHRYYDASNVIDGTLWGQYGDFIGGVIGTLVSVLSVYYLISTLQEQQNANIEVAKNNDKIAAVYTLQQFDSNFSTLLQIYKSVVESYHYKINDKLEKNGRAALIAMGQDLFKNFKCTSSFEESYKAAKQHFDNNFYIPNRDVAAVHFRTLYQLFSLIYSSDIDERKKVLYAKMIRSQLCEEELLLLRYNCHCHYGNQMRKFVNIYNLLKHLPVLSLGEFKKWREFLGNEQNINRIDTEFISLRKHIFNAINGKIKENKQYVINYSPKYMLSIQVADDNQSLELHLTRNNILKTDDAGSIDATFDMFSIEQFEDLFTSFFKELFVYSNFAIYNKLEDIRIETSYTNHSTTNQTSVRIVVTKTKYPLVLSYVDLYSPAISNV